MRLLAPIAAVSLIGGCSSDPEPQSSPSVSDKCVEAMAIAADELNAKKAEPLIRATLTACDSAEEWLAALREHPAAMAVSGPEFVGDVDLQAACLNPDDRETPVCEDAAEDGRL